MNTAPPTVDRRPESNVRTARYSVAVAAALTLAVTGCGSAEESATAPSSTTTVASASMRGQRYCEVLIVKPIDGNITADVYNSWPLNDCPADLWTKLDAKAIAAAQGAPTVLLNGPRFWLMDSIDKTDTNTLPKASFGGIDMYRQASVEIGPLAEAMTPYKPHAVNRNTVFTFDAGRTVYELHGPDGSTYIMQTWSQIVDPELAESDLADLGSRLHPPAGWTYSPRTLSAPLQLVTTTTAAQVLQDDLRNSYSLETPS